MDLNHRPIRYERTALTYWAKNAWSGDGASNSEPRIWSPVFYPFKLPPRKRICILSLLSIVTAIYRCIVCLFPVTLFMIYGTPTWIRTTTTEDFKSSSSASWDMGAGRYRKIRTFTLLILNQLSLPIGLCIVMVPNLRLELRDYSF